MRKKARKKTKSPKGESAYYVTMTDKFFTGWGKAKGKTAKYVLKCKNYQEALIVQRNAKDRPEMKHINIRSSKPYYNMRRYQVTISSRKNARNWYRKSRPFRR